MKSIVTHAAVVLVLVGIWACSSEVPAPQESAAPPESAAQALSLRAGAASGVITPPEGTLLAGYDRNRRSTGVHDDLFAKAVVFYDGVTAAALVVLDSTGIMYDTVGEIRERAAGLVTTIPLPPEHIVVMATHTHCAPDMLGIYGPDEVTSGRDPVYMRHVVETAAAQVARAAAALEPVSLAWARTDCTDWAVNDSEPGVIDHTVTILQCRNAAGTPIATLTHFACHPTVLDGSTTDISADWVGFFYRDMAAVPGEHLYLQGGIGGWIQPKTPERTFALAERYGADLAARTRAALETADPLEGAPVRVVSRPFEMPVVNELFQAISRAGIVPRPIGETVKTEVVWFAVGPAQFATHPGETAPAFTWATHELMKTEPRFVLGLAMDHLGYILKEDYFDNTAAYPHAGYLVSMSPGREAGASMMAALRAAIP